jgi:hypothetical protein
MDLGDVLKRTGKLAGIDSGRYLFGKLQAVSSARKCRDSLFIKCVDTFLVIL